MIKFNHKGDFLTFANLAMAISMDQISNKDLALLARCFSKNGLVVRYPEIDTSMSRSSISPDGLMTQLFSRTLHGNKSLPDWFWHCLKRGGFMRGWGPLEYRFMLIPMVTALSLRFNLPLIPQPLAWARKAKGYRAELAAVYVLLDIVHRGKITERHRKFIKELWVSNSLYSYPSPLLRTMLDKVHVRLMMNIEIADEDRHDWGSCPGPVYRELLKFIRELKV